MSETATGRSAESYACPLCDHTTESRDDVYVHLQLTHRKSELSDALIESSADATEY